MSNNDQSANKQIAYNLKIKDVNPVDNAGEYECRMKFTDGDELSAKTQVDELIYLVNEKFSLP